MSELKGFLYVAVSALCFSIMSLFVKSCSLQASQIVFIRSLAQMLIAIVLCYNQQLSPWGSKRIRLLLTLRGLAGGISVGLYFYGIRYGHLGDTTAIFFTAPAITTILGALIFNHPFLRVHWISICLCFIGSLLVAKPSFLFHQKFNHTLLVSACGAIVSSLAYILIGVIKDRAHHLQLVFYFGLYSTLISMFPMLYFTPVVPSWLDTLKLLGVIVFAFGGQVTVNQGLQMASPSATLMRNLDIVFAFMYSLLIFHEELSILSLIGAVLICSGTALIGYATRKQHREDEALVEDEINDCV